MGKARDLFFCKECGFETTKWSGQCPSCGAWNSIVEAPENSVGKKTFMSSQRRISKSNPVPIKEVSFKDEERIDTHIEELNRTLGGGIVIGSLVLVGGEPGIGKSTLLLQMCRELAIYNNTVLYITGEESVCQVKMRADRINAVCDKLLLFSETDLSAIEEAIVETSPKVVIIDSIQTMARNDIDAAAGSVSQVREVTMSLLRIAKEKGISIFIVGHVTKEGNVAGPKMLEHMVDTVLYFEGDGSASYRILRAVKNRFGSTNEIGVFEMCEGGLKEVQNPSQYMLEGRSPEETGSVITAVMEGTRPILVEVQALVTRTGFTMPKRTSIGVDYNRLYLLAAVLEKRLNIQLGACDIYVNVAGGMRVNETGTDLAIVISLISSYKNKAVDPNMVAFGEIGLTGEVRNVGMSLQRLKEAEKLGYTTAVIPKNNGADIKDKLGNMKIIKVATVRDILNII